MTNSDSNTPAEVNNDNILSIYLHEEILLLALRDREGTTICGPSYTHAMGGAILAELLFAERIAIEGEGRKSVVRVLDTRPVGDMVLDTCLDRIEQSKKQRNIQQWVTSFANVGELKHRTAEALCRLGILKAEIDKVLFVFNRKVYPEINPLPEQALLRRLSEAIFSDQNPVDIRTTVLLALAHHSGLLTAPFGRKELKSRAKRIESVINGDMIGEATKQAIQAMQAAIMVAVIMPAIITTTVIS